MKKSLLALAVLGAFAGAASAQSSVTIYGLLDLAITKGNGGTAPNPGGNGASEAWTMKQSASSRLGFRGNEDLGGGLSAQFQIEHRFTPDDGNAAAPFWAGRSYVQLTSAAAGSVYLGREYVPAFWPAVKSDPFGWDGVGQTSTNQWPYAGHSLIRSSNTLGYRSPNLGGLTVNAAVGLGEGALNRETGFNVEYGAGPIYAGFGYDKLSGGPAGTDGNSLINMALHYNFGVAKLIGYYARSKLNAPAPIDDVTVKAFTIAATAPVGPGTLKAAYSRVDPEGDDNNNTKIGLGYDYPLSKRTNVYADFGRGTSQVDGLKSNTTYGFGVKHTF